MLYYQGQRMDKLEKSSLRFNSVTIYQTEPRMTMRTRFRIKETSEEVTGWGEVLDWLTCHGEPTYVLKVIGVDW